MYLPTYQAITFNVNDKLVAMKYLLLCSVQFQTKSGLEKCLRDISKLLTDNKVPWDIRLSAVSSKCQSVVAYYIYTCPVLFS